MITLTTPAQINSMLGGNVPVAYDKLVIGPYQMNAVDGTVTAKLRMTSTSTPSMAPIMGTLSINVGNTELVVEVSQLNFYRRLFLNGTQVTAVQGYIESGQKQLEDGLIALGVIQGARSVGA